MRKGRGSEKISRGKLAEYVGEKYSDFPSSLEKYVYNKNEDYSIAYHTFCCRCHNRPAQIRDLAAYHQLYKISHLDHKS